MPSTSTAFEHCLFVTSQCSDVREITNILYHCMIEKANWYLYLLVDDVLHVEAPAAYCYCSYCMSFTYSTLFIEVKSNVETLEHVQYEVGFYILYTVAAVKSNLETHEHVERKNGLYFLVRITVHSTAGF
jgi:hypothetical protein